MVSWLRQRTAGLTTEWLLVHIPGLYTGDCKLAKKYIGNILFLNIPCNKTEEKS
jgi:hypothetical protein